MAPGRKFLKQSTISIISPTRVKKIPYTLFLFSDILVIAKKNVLGNYQLKAHVALLVINVKDIEVAPIEGTSYLLMNSNRSILIAIRRRPRLLFRVNFAEQSDGHVCSHQGRETVPHA